MRDELPGLPPADAPAVVVQGPNEILYLPNYWWHATVNLDACTTAVGYADAQTRWLGPSGPRIVSESRAPRALDVAYRRGLSRVLAVR